MGHVLKKTKELLEKYGEFYPFGAGLFSGGQVKYIWAVPQKKVEGRKLDPGVALITVRQALIAQVEANKLLGGATVYIYPKKNKEGKVLGKQINIELEYLNGHSIIRVVPYDMNEDGSVNFGKVIEKEIDAKVFTKERI